MIAQKNQVGAQQRDDPHMGFVKQVAARLQETAPNIVFGLHLIIKTIGEQSTMELLQEVQDIEREGGMLTVDGTRRRTIGGVFFLLVKERYREQLPAKFWYATRSTTSPTKERPAPSALPMPLVPMTWPDRLTAIEELRQQEGGQATVKITLVGRPRNVLDKGTCFMLSMKDNKIPALPKGVPMPAGVAGDTLYIVFIAAKQWRKVQGVMQDPEDVLILEGYPQLDKQTGSISVFVTSAQTKKLQQVLREKQKAEASAKVEVEEVVRG